MRLLGLLLLASCIVGCGGSKKEEEDDAKVTLNGKKEENQNNGEAKKPAEKKLANSSSSSLPKGKAVPADFPKDIPIDQDMVCVTITKVKDDYMITFHSKKTVAEICDWFKAKLGENNWKESGTASITESKGILAYDKLGRKCGVSVTGFVLDAAMQKDNSTRGITIQTKATN